MPKLYLFILLFNLYGVHCFAGMEILDTLDIYLRKSATYDRQKEDKIKMLHKRVAQAHNDMALYNVYNDMYESYSSFKYDSAFIYAQKTLVQAERLKNSSLIVNAKCNVVFCLLSAGLYKEAFDGIDAIDISHADEKARMRYFFTRWRLLADISDYNHAKPYQNNYVKKAHELVDSMKVHLKRTSWEWYYIDGLQQMKEYKYDESEYSFKKLLKDKNLSNHVKAIATSSLGWIYKLNGDNQNALHYLAEAAICDIQSSTKETTALREVGAILYKNGDYNRAILYLQKALDDANMYDARQRKIEIGNILPIIQQDRYKAISRQRNTMLAVIIAVSLLVFVLICSFYFIRRQMRKLQEARNTIEDRNRKLEEGFVELQEANKIKTEYIGKSFAINADYINKVEKLYRAIDHKISAHQYEELRRSLKESTLIADRKIMFADFDETFLKLFPNFIENFNKLFDKKDRKLPENAQNLTTEIRIFALIRLGINDAERIAQFLNYSVNTINTYKTRVKNKSIVSNDEFEQRIMKI